MNIYMCILISCNNIQLQSCKNNNHSHRSSAHQTGKRTLQPRQSKDIDVTNMTDQKLCAPSMPWPWLFRYPSTWTMRYRHVSYAKQCLSMFTVYICLPILVFRLRIFGRSTGRENSDIVGECARWVFRDMEWFLMVLDSQSLFERYIQIGAVHGRPVYRQQGSTTVIRYWSRTWWEQTRDLLGELNELWEHCSQLRPPQKRWVIDREGLRESDVLHLNSIQQSGNLACLFTGLGWSMLFALGPSGIYSFPHNSCS